MRKSSFETTFQDFFDNMAFDIDFLKKIKEAKQVVKLAHEKRSVFEAYVFSICANWEILVENILIDCFNRDTSGYRENTGFKIPKHLSRETCQAIILGTGYLDFKSIDNLKHIAGDFLVPKVNPFEKIPTPNGNKIDEFFVLRNYLAHYSDASRRRLKKIYTNKYGLQTFRRPGDFLLTEDRVKKLPRMAVYINNFLETAVTMAKFLGTDLDIE